MAFDEEGQATTVERRVEICGRAYDLLVDEVGFAPRGLDLRSERARRGDRHRGARRLRQATSSRRCAQIKERCPGARTSAAASGTCSFSFRGNDVVREAMHAVFLYHAIRAGLDMGIVNAGQLPSTRTRAGAARARRGRDLQPPPRCDRAAGRDRRARQGRGRRARARPRLARGPVEERLAHALVHGIVDFIEADTEEARAAPRVRST